MFAPSYAYKWSDINLSSVGRVVPLSKYGDHGTLECFDNDFPAVLRVSYSFKLFVN